MTAVLPVWTTNDDDDDDDDDDDNDDAFTPTYTHTHKPCSQSWLQALHDVDRMTIRQQKLLVA